MKRSVLLVLAAACLTGCAHYDMKLTDGMRITNVTKPKLDKEHAAYVYKDVAGKSHYVSASRVLEITPHSSKTEEEFVPR